MFAMACIDRQNEIDRLNREKAQALARKQTIREQKKKFLAMQKDGSLEGILQIIQDKGVYNVSS